MLRYAARALELSGISSRLAPNFLQWLELARGSTPGSGSAGDHLVREELPHRKSSWRAEAAAYARSCVRTHACRALRRGNARRLEAQERFPRHGDTSPHGADRPRDVHRARHRARHSGVDDGAKHRCRQRRGDSDLRVSNSGRAFAAHRLRTQRPSTACHDLTVPQARVSSCLLSPSNPCPYPRPTCDPCRGPRSECDR